MSSLKTQNVQKKSTIGPGTTQSSMRPSLITTSNLSKATGVNHLQDKSNFNPQQVGYSQKQQQSSSYSGKKRESKPTNDYYTVQNSRNISAQQSVQQSSRNHNNKNGSLGNSTTNKNSTQEQIQQKSQQNEIANNTANFSYEALEKVEPQVAANHQSTVKITQGSFKNTLTKEKQKSRALSTNKTGVNSYLGQFSQNSSSNITLRNQSKVKKQSQLSGSQLITGEGQKQGNYKKSMVQPELQYSPKPEDQSTKSAQSIYKSPQQVRKVNQQSTQNIISSNCSPLPNNNPPNQKGGQSRTATANSDVQKQSNPRMSNNQTIKPKASGTSQTSHLQIDLVTLTIKNDDDITFTYGGTMGSNNQSQIKSSTTNITTANSVKANKKKSSQSKDTSVHLQSQSPSLQISQLSAKSPKNGKIQQQISQQQSNNRHSILNNVKTININSSSKNKQQTPKVNNKESQQQQQKISPQKSATIKGIIIDENSVVKTNTKLQANAPLSLLNSQSQSPLKTDNFDSFSFKSTSYVNQPLHQQQTFPQLQPKDSDAYETEVLSRIDSQNYILAQQESYTTIIQQRSDVKVTSKQMVDLSDEGDYGGIKKLDYIEQKENKLLNFEIEEIKELKANYIYFSGIALNRSDQYIKTTKNKTEAEVLKGLDDEEGYYNVLLGDHLLYRYEIIKILGKGSFAQVVCCLDHKTKQKVAIKITRNTEIDHKFASSESKLLNFLMQKDPDDMYNIVRLDDEFYFRDHHCFVFELLKKDMFEFLKDNGFIGFETGKIREYCIQILQALVFLERYNIIHCDLKPENILFIDDKYEKLKLVDYGSGCFRNDQVYTYVQSRFYRAPEVILRIPYSEKVDIWSLGCILAELYSGEPIFPGNNEQEQLELIMEVCGIPSNSMIDKSRKKDHYFDTDYSPFLIDDEEIGILRIPESRKLEEAVNCQDTEFLDFIKQCLELDAEKRFSASKALDHPWVKKGLQSHTAPLRSQPTMTRRREEDQEGVKGLVYEESPVREIMNEKPKKSLTKHFNFTTIKVSVDDNDSSISTPKNEGGIKQAEKIHELDTKFQIIEQEQVVNEQMVNKPHNGSLVGKRSLGNLHELEKPKNSKLIGKSQYEIIREDKMEDDLRDSQNRPLGIASEANIPPVNQHELINNENQINKITVTFYQKRHTQKK